MVTLGSDFEAKAQRAFAEAIHDAVVDDPDNLAFRFRQQIAANFEAYASRHGYDIQEQIDSLRVVSAERRNDGVHVRLEGGSFLGLWEMGADPYTIDRIEGDPLHWQDPQTGEDVFATFAEDIDHPGFPEARAIRDGIHWLRRDLQS